MTTKRQTLIGIGIAAVAVTMLMLLGRLVPVDELVRWVESLGAWGPIALVGMYVVATVAFVPGAVLTVGAGTLFGVFLGSVAAVAGSNLGAIAAFLTARSLGRKRLEKRLSGATKIERLDRAVKREGFKIVLLTRLAPVLPFNALNYAYGLTRVRFRDYVLGSLLGMLPFTIAYVWIGTFLGAAVGIGDEERAKTPAEWALFVAGVVATLVFSFWAARIAKRAMHGRLKGHA